MARDTDEAAGGASPAAGRSGPAPGWRARADRPLYHVTLWPHRSLSPRGRRAVILMAAAGFALPLLGTLGTPVFVGLLPFCGAALLMLWAAFLSSGRDGRLVEELTLWRDEIRVERREPRGRVLRWRAAPAAVRLRLHAGGRIANYLTLAGGGREIELGAFLTPDERLCLKREIEAALARGR